MGGKTILNWKEKIQFVKMSPTYKPGEGSCEYVAGRLGSLN